MDHRTGPAAADASAGGDAGRGSTNDGADDLIAAVLGLDDLVRTLRERCPWDREQTHTSLRRYLLEETYETLEALDAMTGADDAGADGEDAGGGFAAGGRTEMDRHLCEELGDLLYQVWFQAHMASERGAFDMADVAREVRAKLVARHPHVFGDVEAGDADAVRGMWDAIKLREKGRDSVMDGIPATLPALLRAVKIQKRAAVAGLLDQPGREHDFAEFEQAASDFRDDPGEQRLGELLLAAVELARRLKLDPEDALRSTTEHARRTYRAWEQQRR